MPVEHWFPVSIFFEDVALSPELREGVVEAILEQKDAEKIGEFTAITANSARHDLHHDPRVSALFDELESVFARFLVEGLRVDSDAVSLSVGRCWPVIQISNGSSGQKHHHREAVYSAVMYFQVPSGSGGIEFFKPLDWACDALPKREFAAATFGTARYKAKEGRLLIFPSELEHRRLANETKEANDGADEEGARLAIAFDLYATVDLARYEGGRPHAENHRTLALEQ